MDEPYIKTGHAADEQAALRAEAEHLRMAAHPGVVEIVGLVDADDRVELHLARAACSLADLQPLDPAEVAGVGAAIARTLGELHRWGVYHGRIEASHVLLLDHGQPVLTGLRGASVDAGADDGRASRDVSMLATMLAALLPPPAATRPLALLRRDEADRLRSALAALQARPPSAEAAAERLAKAHPSPALPSPLDAPRDPSPLGGPIENFWAEADAQADSESRRLRAAGVALLLVAALFGLFVWPGVGGQPPGDGPGAADQSAEFAIQQADETAGAETVPAASAVDEPALDAAALTDEKSCAPPNASLHDLSGDGCGEAVAISDGVVETPNRSWRVAAAGDLVVLGDWDCDGIETPAVLASGSRGVYVYDEWADHAAARRVAEPSDVGEAVDISRDLHPALPCHLLLVVDRGGSIHPIDLTETA